MKDDYFIARVYVNKSNNQKLLTVPSKCSIKDGDIVVVKLLKDIVEE